MAGIVIDVRTSRLDEEQFEEVCYSLLDFIVDLSPVDTGYFASQWEIDFSYPRCRFINDTPYGEYLDRGWSQQAPNGITGPALDYLSNLVP